jgi:hypothetical protein
MTPDHSRFEAGRRQEVCDVTILPQAKLYVDSVGVPAEAA